MALHKIKETKLSKIKRDELGSLPTDILDYKGLNKNMEVCTSVLYTIYTK